MLLQSEMLTWREGNQIININLGNRASAGTQWGRGPAAQLCSAPKSGRGCHPQRPSSCCQYELLQTFTPQTSTQPSSQYLLSAPSTPGAMPRAKGTAGNTRDQVSILTAQPLEGVRHTQTTINGITSGRGEWRWAQQALFLKLLLRKRKVPREQNVFTEESCCVLTYIGLLKKSGPYEVIPALEPSPSWVLVPNTKGTVLRSFTGWDLRLRPQAAGREPSTPRRNTFGDSASCTGHRCTWQMSLSQEQHPRRWFQSQLPKPKTPLPAAFTRQNVFACPDN